MSVVPRAHPLDLTAHVSTWLESRVRARQRLFWMGVLLVAVMGISVFLGRYPQLGLMSPTQMLEDPLAQRLILNLRLPRLLAAMLVGMSLAVAGLVLQMVFSNPLVEPGFLGVSQAAAFGAALSIILFGGMAWRVQVSAILFGMGGLALSYLLARRVRYGGWVLRLLLSGIAVSAFFAAGVGLIKYLADPLRQLPEITFWLLGGLSSVTWKPLLSALPLMMIGLLVLFLMRWRLNLLALEDEVAFSLGVAVHRERLLALLAAVMVTAASISIGGLIGWVGLLVPQLARRLSGADARYTLPTALLLGGTFGVVCDDLARILSAGEIPLGVLTSILGAVGFLILMTRPTIKV
ncbi:iron ABC transporter permease [uncultured Thermanaerothrix sp.]|uniref:FecCD family ABC transporter permease n=1 Tax=uncultured Thermanaerothrix sp. TaxID=1195149 RepID=UPI0026120CC2|nr:iron ABC transporter permease [uncultured Thermanaerothrix sp.]